MEKLLAYLRQIAPLSAGATERIVSMMQECFLPRNTFLFKAGRINSQVHFVESGLVWCFKRWPARKGREEREITKWYFLPGEIIASRQSYDLQVPSTEYYMALEPTTVLTTNFAALDGLCAAYPEFLRHYLVIVSRYATLFYNLLDIKPSLTPSERYQLLEEAYPQLLQRVPAKYLATLLGMHPTTISRIRGRRRIS